MLCARGHSFGNALRHSARRGTTYATRAFPMGSGGNCRVCVSARTIVLMDWVAGTVPVYLDRWAIQPHGETVATPSSWLVPGRWHDRDVMLKVARIAEEGRGGRVLAWWSGYAAAKVYEVSDQAVLMDRASGQRDLTTMSQTGLDDEVTHILCGTISSLHSASAISAAPAEVVPLSRWFQDLIGADAERLQAGSMARAAAMARELLGASDTEAQVVLHGTSITAMFLISMAAGWPSTRRGCWVTAHSTTPTFSATPLQTWRCLIFTAA